MRQSKLRLHVVPFTEIQKAIKRFRTKIYRAFVSPLYVSNRQSVGQRMALRCFGDRRNLKLQPNHSKPSSRWRRDWKDKLWPLITYDKHDIVRLAEKIDTFEILTQPFEDWCTLFVGATIDQGICVWVGARRTSSEIDNLVAASMVLKLSN